MTYSTYGGRIPTEGDIRSVFGNQEIYRNGRWEPLRVSVAGRDTDTVTFNSEIRERPSTLNGHRINWENIGIDEAEIVSLQEARNQITRRSIEQARIALERQARESNRERFMQEYFNSGVSPSLLEAEERRLDAELTTRARQEGEAAALERYIQNDASPLQEFVGRQQGWQEMIAEEAARMQINESFNNNNNSTMVVSSPFDRAISILQSFLPSDIFQALFVKEAPERRTLEFLKETLNEYIHGLPRETTLMDSMGRNVAIVDWNIGAIEDEVVVIKCQGTVTDIPNVYFYNLFRKQLKKPGKECIAPGAFVKLDPNSFVDKIMSGFMNLQNLTFFLADPETTPVNMSFVRIQRIERGIPTNVKRHFAMLNDFASSKMVYEFSEDILVPGKKEDYDKQETFVMSEPIRKQMEEKAKIGRQQAEANYKSAADAYISSFTTLKACLSADPAKDAEMFANNIKIGADRIRKMKGILYANVINPYKISVVTDVIKMEWKDARGAVDPMTIGHYNIIIDLQGQPGVPPQEQVKMFLMGSDPRLNQHPHVNSTGKVCWGDGIPTVAAAMAAYDIATIVLTCLELLQTYNDGNPYIHWQEFERSTVSRLPTNIFKHIDTVAQIKNPEAETSIAPGAVRRRARARTATQTPPPVEPMEDPIRTTSAVSSSALQAGEPISISSVTIQDITGLRDRLLQSRILHD